VFEVSRAARSLILTTTVVEDSLYTISRIISESTLLEKDRVKGIRNITTTAKSLFSISCLFQAEGYCIDALCVIFSYFEKPLTVVDITADEVVGICDDNIN
jgi:hypothetical protein